MERRRFVQLLSAAMIGIPATAQDIPRPETLLPLFPLDLVLLPQTNLPLHIFEERYKEMIRDCLENSWEFGIVAVRDRSVEAVGCTASISRVLDKFPDGRLNILVRGRRRFEVSMVNREKSYLRGQAAFLEDEKVEPADADLQERALRLYRRLTDVAHLENEPFQEPLTNTSAPQLSYRMMAGVPAELDWKQQLLELRSESERLVRVMDYFERLLKQIERPAAPRQII
jgi:Lon protease-like protein